MRPASPRGAPRAAAPAAVALALLLVLVGAPLAAVAFCASEIYCTGPVLDTVQRAGVFNDSKYFVDSPTSKPVDQVLAAFAQLGQSPTVEAVRSFFDQNFLPAGSEVERVLPLDWSPQPAFLDKIRDPLLRKFALSLNTRWLKLVRTFNATAACEGCAVSSIPLKNPFVVAGGRFREAYYWDSYFILRGLLISQMYATAKGVIEDMLDLVDEYGFMPNGARVYYLNRSQPPLLAPMVWEYYDRTHDKELLRRALATLEREHAFWMTNRTVSIAAGTDTHVLNIYNVTNDKPRPEGYVEDLKVAAALNGTAEETAALYGKISSACESGWDMSSRWNLTPLDSTSIRVPQIVPVDLNAIMYLAERTLAKFNRILATEDGAGGLAAREAEFEAAADRRARAMSALLWDGARGIWRDYDWGLGRLAQTDDAWYASSLFPLWAGVPGEADGLSSSEMGQKVVAASMKALTGFVGGMPSSLTYTDEQWDFPKAWPPLQYFAIKGVLQSNASNGEEIAASLIRRWLNTNYCGWALTGGLEVNETVNPIAEVPGYMFEKYDARKVGVPGDGGEYVVQEGFGWSNGVVLWILDEFALRLNLTAPESCQNEGLLDGDPTDANVFGPLRLAATRPLAAAVGGAAFFAGVGAAWFGYRRMRKRVSGPERHEMA